MPGQPCTNHPNELTFVKCGRCDQPFCVRCLVDTPVGKKCRPCATNRTHLEESTGGQVGLAFLAALVVAVIGGWLVHTVHFIPILAVPFGYVVAEVALRAGKRSRSRAMQVAVGLATLIGAFVGAGLPGPAATLGVAPAAFSLKACLQPFALIVTGVSVVVAVSRVRYL